MRERYIQSFAKKSYGDFIGSQKYLLEEHENRSIIDSTEKNKILVERFGENSQREEEINLTPIIKRAFNNGPLFKYFLDGSRRAYKVADVTYDEKPFPIVAGQSAVGCVERKSRSKFKSKINQCKTIIAVPGIAGNESDIEKWKNELDEKVNLKYDFKVDKIESYDYKALKDGGSYENRAIATIHEHMIDSEKAIVHQLAQADFLNEETYLLKDGSLEYSKNVKRGQFKEMYKIKKSFQRVVGVSKSFNPESLSKDKRQRKIANSIAKLKKFHRTPAFQYQADYTSADDYFAVWYLRLRERYSKNASPYDGIVKVEKILVTDAEKDEGLDSAEVDNISSNLIIERNPTTFGQEERWHNHLYPVYITENFVKTLFHSREYFLNIL